LAAKERRRKKKKKKTMLTNIKFVFLVTVALYSALVAGQCGNTSALATLEAHKTVFSSFLDAIDSLGNQSSVEALYQRCNLTVFAPTNEAIQQNGPLPTTEEALTRLLEYHVVPGEQLLPANLTNERLLDSSLTLASLKNKAQKLKVTNNGTIFINGAAIIMPNVSPPPNGGAVHGINNILFPPESIFDELEANELTEIQSLIDLAGLKEEFDNLISSTAFFPTNEAVSTFTEYAGYLDILREQANTTLKDILEYHVVTNLYYSDRLLHENTTELPTLEGSSLEIFVDGSDDIYVVDSISRSEVVSPNLLAENGVIHSIDSVLVPPSTTIAPLELLKTLGLTEFINFYLYSDILSIVTNQPDLVVFVPTNAAFSAVNFHDMQLNETREVFLNHISMATANERYSLVDGAELATIEDDETKIVITKEGDDFFAHLEGPTVKSEDNPKAKITEATYPIVNGTIFGSYFIIDAVLGIEQEDSDGGGLSTAEKVGIIVGSVVGGLIICCLLVLCIVVIVVALLFVTGGLTAVIAKTKGYEHV
jgi:uncharacterized surface protein with fasciclin (FAS1) repeats